MILLLRVIGGAILSSGVLNFMVMNHSDNITFKAILVFNIVFHALGMLVDFYGMFQNLVHFEKTVVGNGVHVFVIIGCMYYLMKMKK